METLRIWGKHSQKNLAAHKILGPFQGFIKHLTPIHGLCGFKALRLRISRPRESQGQNASGFIILYTALCLDHSAFKTLLGCSYGKDFLSLPGPVQLNQAACFGNYVALGACLYRV